MQTIVAQITAADVAMITMTTKATKTRRSSKITSCCSSDSQQKAASLLPSTKQVIARRDDIPPPIAADLSPYADGPAVRTALVACGRTDRGIA